jgi:hypothetical protein
LQIPLKRGDSRWKGGPKDRGEEDTVTTIWMTLLSHWRIIIIIKKSLVNGESVWIFPLCSLLACLLASYQSLEPFLGPSSLYILYNCTHANQLQTGHLLCGVCLMLWHME